ncbi:MAG: tetratricopeptide repeat protein [Candidatus Electrothrix sp. GM3_4]|nr:tetratricopeptide repeat protein [Candidatus Electrothrix sp. GM3_4]
MTARQLADKLGWDVNTTSSQLNRLQQQALVEKVEPASGKRAAFQIGERFFNIWYLMRASRRVRRRLIWLVHFLRMFFSADELQGHARKLLGEQGLDVRRAEYKLALARAMENKCLCRALEHNALSCLVQEKKDRKKIEALLDLEGEDAELRPQLESILENIKDEKLRHHTELIYRAMSEEIMTSMDDIDGAEHAVRRYKAPGLAATVWDNWFTVHQVYDLSEQQAKQAEDAFKKELEADPFNADYWNILGNLFWMAMKFEKAEHACKKAIENAPFCGIYWRNHGMTLDKLERPDEAEKALKKAIELNPNDGDLWLRLADFLVKKSRYDESEKIYKKALEVEPELADVWYSLGLLLMELNRHKDAEHAFREAIRITPNDIYALNALATLLQVVERLDEAEQICRRMKTLQPNSDIIYNKIAWLLYKQTKGFDEAIILAQKSLNLSSENNLDARHTLAALLTANKQWQEAEPYIRSLLNKGDDEFFEERWQDMLTLFKEAVRTGKAAEALRLLDETPYAERWRPLREALAAAAQGDSRYLNGVAPEVRQPALAILKEIAPDLMKEK